MINTASLKPSMAIRVDASSRIGVGHAMRCFALAQQALIDGYSVIVIYHELPLFLQHQYTEQGIQLHHIVHSKDVSDANYLAEILIEQQVDLCLLDGYHFSQYYVRNISNLIHHNTNHPPVITAIFDDLNDSGNLHANCVINAMPNAKALNYENTSNAKFLLLGLPYCVLRQEFTFNNVTDYSLRDKLIVSFGGSDIGNLTLPVITSLARKLPKTQYQYVQVIVGGACLAKEEIKSFCEHVGFEYIVQSNKMAQLMAQAKMAIAAPGSIVYELCFFHVPSIFFTVADNQKLSARAHQKLGWCDVYDGCDLELINKGINNAVELWQNSVERRNKSKKACTLIDGQGPSRIIDIFTRLINER